MFFTSILRWDEGKGGVDGPAGANRAEFEAWDPREQRNTWKACGPHEEDVAQLQGPAWLRPIGSNQIYLQYI